jgi:hypothetical protein
MQRVAGLFGSLIVSLPSGKTEPFSYDGDLSVLLSDWYHKSIYQQELGLSSIPFQFVGEPQVGSLLACLDSLLPSSDHYPFSDSRETLSSLFPELLLLLLLWIGVVSLLLLLVSSDLCWFLFCGCCMDGSTCCVHTVAADPGAWEVQLLARPASRRVCSKLISRLFAVQCHKPRLRTFRVACAAWEDLPLAHRQHGYTLFPQLQDRGKPILNPPQLCSSRTHRSILGLQNSWFSSGASRSFLTVCCCSV